MITRLAAVELPLSSECRLILADAGLTDPEASLTRLEGLPLEWRGRIGDERSGIAFDPVAPSRGLHALQLYENRSYFWTAFSLAGGLDASALMMESSLKGQQAEFNARLVADGQRWSGDLRVSGYLGTAWLGAHGEAPIHFDVISKKLDFETEYRSMMDAIADECHQLILAWNSPTATPIAPDPTRAAALLLERFLFLNHVLGPGRLELYLELVHRNSHAELLHEDLWRPVSDGATAEFLIDPIRNGRDWVRTIAGGLATVAGRMPSQVRAQRKYESRDTAPNRFVRFALETFRDVCDQVTEHFSKDGGAAFLEALRMRDTIDELLASPFFNEVGRMARLPLESQVLQKREGYRQILQAWLMLDAASQLNWPGRDVAYDGTNRNVPVLYEYWLYFVLARVLRDQLGLEELSTSNTVPDDGIPSFITRDAAGLVLKLKQGRCSRLLFRTVRHGPVPLRVHFYFNRRFPPSRDPITPGASYSRHLRPDYSIVVFPEEYAVRPGLAELEPLHAEASAESDGRIAYLHFDAKYRVERLSELFGIGPEDPDPPGEDHSDRVDRELDEEHVLSATTNTYKRGDLYKMHAYNEAIRRTIGAYVLYPGTDSKAARYQRYHELLPGVGAFVLRPSYDGDDPVAVGERVVGKFINDVLWQHADHFSQLYRINYYAHDTIQRAPELTVGHLPPIGNQPPADTEVLLLEVGDIALADVSERHGVVWIPVADGTGSAIEANVRSLEANFVLLHSGSKCASWCGEVGSTTVMARGRLTHLLGLDSNVLSGDSMFYYLLRLTRTQDVPPLDIGRILSHGMGTGVVRMVKWSYMLARAKP